MNGLPTIIQGGMGIAVSDWRLANAVSSTGQLGVVSGTAIDAVLVRRLQMGDPEGHVRRALAAFPIPGVAERTLDRYFVDGGIPEGKRHKTRPMAGMVLPKALEELIVLANFVEVYLAKEGHGNPVGINFLEKIQAPTLPSLYGAMLGGVDYVLMGAGIPRAIPGILDELAEGSPVKLKIDVKGTGGDDTFTHFDPVAFGDGELPPVKRPAFLAIIASVTLGALFVRKVEARVDGLIVEAPTAGGHNAPPRGKPTFTDEGEPVYGERDEVDLEAIRDLGLPFWVAGSVATPEGLQAALDVGATGIQVGTAFAFCEESGFVEERKRDVLEMSRRGESKVFTDPVASPTGFPFKVIPVDGTLSDQEIYEARERVCDLGYLRSAYRRENGKIGWRCPAEPVDDWLKKGGDLEETVGRKCLCNSLMANVGLGTISGNDTPAEMLLTSGDDVANVARFLPEGKDTYTAADVIEYLLAGVRIGSSDTDTPA